MRWVKIIFVINIIKLLRFWYMLLILITVSYVLIIFYLIIIWRAVYDLKITLILKLLL